MDGIKSITMIFFQKQMLPFTNTLFLQPANYNIILHCTVNIFRFFTHADQLSHKITSNAYFTFYNTVAFQISMATNAIEM